MFGLCPPRRGAELARETPVRTEGDDPCQNPVPFQFAALVRYGLLQLRDLLVQTTDLLDDHFQFDLQPGSRRRPTKRRWHWGCYSTDVTGASAVRSGQGGRIAVAVRHRKFLGHYGFRS